MAGLDAPVEPRKRTWSVFDCANTPKGSATVYHGRLPPVIDPSGIFCRPEGRSFLSGAAPVQDPALDLEDFEPHHEGFEDMIWPTLSERFARFDILPARQPVFAPEMTS